MLSVRDLRKTYAAPGSGLLGKRRVQALDGVDLDIRAGETLGLVGESGSGKSTAARCILRLEEPTSGVITFADTDVSHASATDLRRLRRRMQMVYQDPLDSLNPRLRVGDQVAEPIWLHQLLPRSAIKSRVAELLDLVGLSSTLAGRFPHQLSGGQQQRVAIARALACEPSLLVLDEPTSSLDVSVQAQIVRLLAELQARLGLTYLLISHDLALVGVLAHRVAVMYLGQIVESGTRDEVFTRPAHPYTRALLSATPRNHPDEVRERILLRAEPDRTGNPTATCRLYPRCPYAQPVCLERPATLEDVGPTRAVRCVRFLAEHVDLAWNP